MEPIRGFLGSLTLLFASCEGGGHGGGKVPTGRNGALTKTATKHPGKD